MPSFSLRVHCDSTSWGENVAVLGSWNAWDKSAFNTLSTSPADYPTWHASVSVPSHRTADSIEYKYAIVADNRIVRWESSSLNNRVIVPSKSTSSDDVFGDIPRDAASNGTHHFNGSPDLAATRKWQPAANAAPALPSDYDGSPLDPLERALVRHTHHHHSWRQRLAFVRTLFTDPDTGTAAAFDRSSLDALASIAVYVTFLSTGQLRCAEDGGHHRPNHHAHEARQIDAALAAVIADARHAAPHARNAYLPCVARKIFPLLPSYSSQFTVSVPLTRIRDIAHRSDIPKDVKLDIKHNLQNKLHRCAGPEDLHTSARILNHISHGGFSQPFVDQFHIFHAELQAFFNASSLDDRLRYLAASEHTRAAAHLAGQLLADKHRGAAPDAQLDAVVALRHALADLPLMRVPDDPSALPSEDVQKTRLADIDLENYAFVLLAAEAKAAEEGAQDFPWARALRALARAMTTIAQSGVRPDEATATARELDASAAALDGRAAAGDAASRARLQRARAAVDRALRFAHAFSAALTDVYERRAATLGAALGVEQRAVAVFAEAEIRSAVAFQASRLADACARAARAALSLPPWDPLFEGVARGELVFADALDSVPSGGAADVVVVARHADGDEDIPARVRGVVLGRAVPHLSHLGVRARQAGVVFVCAEEQEAFARVWETGGRGVHELAVTSSAGLASLRPASSNGTSDGRTPPVTVNGASAKAACRVASDEISFDDSAKTVLPIEEATKQNASSKASFAGRLAKLASSSGGLFDAPGGVAVPHGIFQKEVERLGDAYAAVTAAYDEARASGNDKAQTAADAAAKFIRNEFVVDDDVVEAIQAAFVPGAHVMVRSSANAEDLEHMSGAGLYDSVANVAVDDADALRGAVGKVWGSLWTRRAASSRAAYEVPHAAVSMAVLVQEMATAQVSFVAFSHDPVSQAGSDDGAVYMEMAVGMGETLASASGDGNPFRFRVGRKELDVEVVAMGSYSEALVPDGQRGGGGTADGLKRVVVDYSSERLTADEQFRAEVAQRVAKTVLTVEGEFGGPQDVEGAVTVDGGKCGVHVVQARPQIR